MENASRKLYSLVHSLGDNFKGLRFRGKTITDRYEQVERSEQASVENVNCPLCGGSDTEPLLDGADLLHNIPGRFGVDKCGRCGFAFTNPRPDAESIARFYPPDYAPRQPKAYRPAGFKHTVRRAILTEFMGYPGRRSLFRRLVLWPLYIVWRRLPKSLYWPRFFGKGRILDVGCGAGRLLWKLSLESWSVKGMDVSRQASKSAKQYCGIDVLVGTYPHEHFPAESFEVVTLWSSLEHVADPVGVLRSAAAVLVPGGVLIAGVPNFGSFGAKFFRDRWFPLDLPRHLNHFTVETLSTALKRAGLACERTAPLPRTSSLRKSARRAVAAGDRRVLTLVLWTRLGAGIARRFLSSAAKCDLIIAVASKPGKGA